MAVQRTFAVLAPKKKHKRGDMHKIWLTPNKNGTFRYIRVVSIIQLTLKPGLGVTEGHRNRHGSICHNDFLLTFHSNHGPMS